ATEMQWNVNIILGIIASIACGLGAVLCTIYSKQLSRAGWTSSMILSKRSYGIILFSFFFTYDLIFDYTMENISWILVVRKILFCLSSLLLFSYVIFYVDVNILWMVLSLIRVFRLFLFLVELRLYRFSGPLVGVLSPVVIRYTILDVE